MEFDVLDMISKDLGRGGKRLPTIGFQLTSDDADLLEHVLSVGYRHFMFEPRFTTVLAETLQEYAGDEDIFLTLRVPVHTSHQKGAQHIVLEALQILGIQSIDMVLLYENENDIQEDKQERGYILNSRWLELENLCGRGIVKNIGLYSDSPEDVQRVVTRSQCKPSIVILPNVCICKEAPKTCRHDVITSCKQMDVKLGVAASLDVRKGLNSGICPPKVLCRSVVESGFSYVVNSSDEANIVEASQAFDHAVPMKQRLSIMKSLGMQL